MSKKKNEPSKLSETQFEQLSVKLSQLSTAKKKELRAILNTANRTDYYNLKKKLNKKDIKKILKLLDDGQKKPELYKTYELRPLPFSKTVTVFDVYETDEENFQPYISPFATIGAVKTSDDSISSATGTDTSTTSTGTKQETIETEQQQPEEKKGLLGLGGIL